MGHGPALESGFFYDVFLPEKGKVIDQAQLDIISKTMKEFVLKCAKENDQQFERLLISKSDALELFSYSKLKSELIADHVKEGELCSIYKCGCFVDFCRGPHVYDLSILKAFSCQSCSAAYFKGD